jgi:hypothetical protein
MEENCQFKIPFPDSGVESSLARLQLQYESARLRTPQLISFKNIHIRPKPNSSNIFVDIEGKDYGAFTIELQSAGDVVSPDLKINSCNAIGCSSNKRNFDEKFDKTKLYSGKVIKASRGITHKNVENAAFFFIDQSINRSIDYILGMFRINDLEVINLEPYSHRPLFTVGKASKNNLILYSSKIIPGQIDKYQFGKDRKGTSKINFDPNRTVAPIKLIIHKSMFKSAIDEIYWFCT